MPLFLGFINGDSLVVKNTDHSGILDDYKFSVVFFDHLRLMREIPVELFLERAFHWVEEYVSQKAKMQLYYYVDLNTTL